MIREAVLAQLTDAIASIERLHPVRVGIDGIDAAGKTILAAELAPRVEARGRPVISASVDGFHNPRDIRYRRGRRSPEGYYQDSYDYERLHAYLLEPLGPGGHRRYRAAAFDWREDGPVDAPERVAPEDAILILDGIFLQRPELAPVWDLVIWVEISEAVGIERSRIRHLAEHGNDEGFLAPHRERYVAGQALYLAACDPRARADFVFGNDEPAEPTLRRRRGQTDRPSGH